MLTVSTTVAKTSWWRISKGVKTSTQRWSKRFSRPGFGWIKLTSRDTQRFRELAKASMYRLKWLKCWSRRGATSITLIKKRKGKGSYQHHLWIRTCTDASVKVRRRMIESLQLSLRLVTQFKNLSPLTQCIKKSFNNIASSIISNLLLTSSSWFQRSTKFSKPSPNTDRNLACYLNVIWWQ